MIWPGGIYSIFKYWSLCGPASGFVWHSLLSYLDSVVKDLEENRGGPHSLRKEGNKMGLIKSQLSTPTQTGAHRHTEVYTYTQTHRGIYVYTDTHTHTNTHTHKHRHRHWNVIALHCTSHGRPIVQGRRTSAPLCHQSHGQRLSTQSP